MTGKLLTRVITDRNLRWDPNFTGPWWLMFPGYNEPDSPFHDKRVRRAISHAIDRQGLVEAVWGRGAPTPAVARGLVEWSLPIEQLGEGAKYYASDSSWNIGHVNDPALTAMLKEQRRVKDLEARRKIIFAIQRYAAEQQYYVYLNSNTITGSWQPYVKNFVPSHSFDIGNRAAALWLER
jgi:ABC-type transport system substrate-binding protein